MHLSFAESQLRLRRDGFAPCPMEHLGAVMHVPVITTSSSFALHIPAQHAVVACARSRVAINPAPDLRPASGS
jgi:hypothetical protein